MKRFLPFIFVINLILLFFSYNAIAGDTEQIAKELKGLLQGISGVEIKVIGDFAFIDGESDDPRAVAKISEIADSLSGVVKSLVKLSEKGKTQVAQLLEKAIGVPGISVRFLNNALVLEGTAENDFVADRSVEFAKTYLNQFPVAKNISTEGKAQQEGRSPSAAEKEIIRGNSAFGNGAVVLDLIRVRPHAKPK